MSGDDAANFLQGQLTNDLRTLERERAVYGLWLTVKGKVLADSFVLREAATGPLWIGSYFSSAATIRERIESHVIADDVVIEDFTAAWGGLSIIGDEASQILQSSPGPDSGFVFHGRRIRGPNTECVFPTAAGEPAWVTTAVGEAREIDADEVTRLRIESAIPAIPKDLGPGDLPNEGGLDQEAISYTKGCYLGQEVMARLKSMGQVRRRLLRVQCAGEQFPALPAPVFANARQAGELRSAVRDSAGGWIGLAMVSLLHVKAGAELAFAADAAPTLRLIDSP